MNYPPCYTPDCEKCASKDSCKNYIKPWHPTFYVTLPENIVDSTAGNGWHWGSRPATYLGI